jgi:hypothetical protein
VHVRITTRNAGEETGGGQRWLVSNTGNIGGQKRLKMFGNLQGCSVFLRATIEIPFTFD